MGFRALDTVNVLRRFRLAAMTRTTMTIVAASLYTTSTLAE